jgi:predicted unusual protein kinase regulating ubiquinone biosynthesis (AarF/ABC1/UbiB family)
MADEMKSLRGAAMKFGQTLSLQTGTLPDETLAELSDSTDERAADASFAGARNSNRASA